MPSRCYLPFPDCYLPPEDVARIGTLTSSSQVHEYAAARIEEYRSRIRALGSFLNATAPLNDRLPNEVLIEILSRLRPQSFSHIRYLHVCRLWRHLLLRAPVFWVDMLQSVEVWKMTHRATDAPSHEKFNFVLTYSSPRPFTLSLRGFPERLVQDLALHSHRIRSLTVSVELDEIAGLNQLFDGGMPSLESLRVVVSPNRRPHLPSQRSIPLRTAEFPRLHTFGTGRSHFAVASALPTLVRLDLSQCTCADCLDTEQQTFDPLLDALELCTNLETLNLTDCLPSAHGDADHRARCTPGRRVHLPSLRRLHVKDTAESISILLTHLGVPMTATISIPNVEVSTSRAVLKLVLPSNLQHFRPICAADGVYVKYRSRRFTLKTSVGSVTMLHLVLVDLRHYDVYGPYEEPPSPPRYGRELAKLFAPFPAITSLTVDSWTFNRDEWLLILTSFRHLLRLEAPTCDGLHTVLPLLVGQTSSGAGLCPSLEELAVGWRYNEELCVRPYYEHSDIFEMLASMWPFQPEDYEYNDHGKDEDAFYLEIDDFWRDHGQMDEDTGTDEALPEGATNASESAQCADDPQESDSDDATWRIDRAAWEAESWHPSFPAVAFFGVLVAGILEARLELPRPRKLKKLTIHLPEVGAYLYQCGDIWYPEEVQKRICDALANIVEQLAVVQIPEAQERD